MSGADRQLRLIRLFTRTHPVWTAEEAAAALGVSVSTCYRYINGLCQTGFLDPVAGKGYILGPAFVEYDHLIRDTDPLLAAARPVMRSLLSDLALPAGVLLCRLYQERVMCIDQALDPAFRSTISYERGRPMPLLRGATSKIILSYLPARALQRVHEAHRESGDLADWKNFKAEMGQLRRDGFCLTQGTVNPGIVGIAAPVFNNTRSILGSLSIVLQEDHLLPAALGRMTSLVIAGARQIDGAMADGHPIGQPPARMAAGTSLHTREHAR